MSEAESAECDLEAMSRPMSSHSFCRAWALPSVSDLGIHLGKQGTDEVSNCEVAERWWNLTKLDHEDVFKASKTDIYQYQHIYMLCVCAYIYIYIYIYISIHTPSVRVQTCNICRHLYFLCRFCKMLSMASQGAYRAGEYDPGYTQTPG